MEPQFDKEIHALLHNFGKTAEPQAIPDAEHLDADELSAFAENAVPDKAKSFYVEHLAICDRCRKALSSRLPASVPKTVSAKENVVVLEKEQPWYRTLFAFGRLAYVMGALVVAFTGLTAFVLFQSMNSSGGFERAAADQNAAPAQVVEQHPAGNANVSANSTSVAASSESEIPQTASNARILNSNSSVRTEVERTERAKEERDEAALGASTTIAPLQIKPGAVSDQSSIVEEEKSSRSNAADSVAAAEPKPAPVAVPSKPADREIATAKKQTQKDDNYAEGQLALKSKTSRSVSGKTFNFRDGVWYDSNYSNQKTRNLRRGSSDYKKLDSQLRAIVEKIDGTVVVVWKSEAFRIQK